LESETAICPFCGSHYRARLVSGAPSAECKECGGLFLTPSGMINQHRKCTNHPFSEAIGLCSGCGRSFCEECFSARDQAGKYLYLCPTCTRRFIIADSRYSIFVIVFGASWLLIGVWLLQTVSYTIWTRPLLDRLAPYGIVMLLAGVLLMLHRPKMRTLEEKLRDDWMHKSTNWQECPYCKAGYLYSPYQIKRDRTVNCQNCGRMFKLEGTVPAR
jgi:hypothetical protein